MNQLSFSGEVTHAGLFISQSCPINHSQSWRGPRLHFVKRKRRLREVSPLPRGHTVRGSGGRGTHVFSIPNVITRTRTSQTPLCGRGGGACSCRLLQGQPQWQRAGYWGQPEEAGDKMGLRGWIVSLQTGHQWWCVEHRQPLAQGGVWWSKRSPSGLGGCPGGENMLAGATCQVAGVPTSTSKQN